jgi:hypothetical protein
MSLSEALFLFRIISRFENTPGFYIIGAIGGWRKPPPDLSPQMGEKAVDGPRPILRADSPRGQSER